MKGSFACYGMNLDKGNVMLLIIMKTGTRVNCELRFEGTDWDLLVNIFVC